MEEAMAKDYFQFKQFSVSHAYCGMKVGTDGVLLGAWSEAAKAERILDVGTGSGLVALMLAQRSEAYIKGVDIEFNAVKQSRENFKNSPWGNRMCAEEVDFTTIGSGWDKHYDLIVSNPPYFENSLTAPNKQRSTARHTETLSFEDLFRGVQLSLNTTGRLCLILPAQCEERIEQIAANLGYFATRKCYVHPKPESEPKRILWEFRAGEQEVVIHHLTVELARHHYSPEYIELTKAYYLKM